jgi:four helix bundle protein
MSKQLLRCGTSIGANINEAQAAQSKKDFISKMSIASKEARETLYWINLLIQTNYLNQYDKLNSLKNKINSIVRILTKIVKTSQENLNRV